MLVNHTAIACADLALQAKTSLLATKLNLPMVAITNTDYKFLLVMTAEHLEIHFCQQPSINPVYIDFLAGKLAYRREHTFIKNELLAKAVGIKGNQSLTIIDATAGLGRDAFILASLGADVLMLERSPILAALLEDGLTRLLAQTKESNPLAIHLLNVDAINYLQPLTMNAYPEVIYLDPMYPHRTKTALVKKEMRLLRELVGNDIDADELFKTALLRARKRTVVKRPILAEPLNQQKPDIQYKGKQHRFDVYLVGNK